MENTNKPSQQPFYPLLPVIDTLVMPSCESVLIVGRPKSLSALNQAIQSDNKIVIVTQKNSKPQPEIDDLQTFGVLAHIERVNPSEKGETQILVKGLEKVAISNFMKTDPYIEVSIIKSEEILYDDAETTALVHHIA